MEFEVSIADWQRVLESRRKTERIRDEWEADEEVEWDSMYMGSDSDFSDHALGIDY